MFGQHNNILLFTYVLIVFLGNKSLIFYNFNFIYFTVHLHISKASSITIFINFFPQFCFFSRKVFYEYVLLIPCDVQYFITNIIEKFYFSFVFVCSISFHKTNIQNKVLMILKWKSFVREKKRKKLLKCLWRAFENKTKTYLPN